MRFAHSKTEATDELVDTLISDRHDCAAIFIENFLWRVEIGLITKITVSASFFSYLEGVKAKY